MTKQIKIKRNPNLVARTVEKKLYILDPKEEKLFTLEGTALDIWRYLWRPRTPQEIVERLSKEYNVSPLQINKDMQTFIKNSQKTGLTIVD